MADTSVAGGSAATSASSDTDTSSKWIEQLDISKALSGASLALKVHHAKNALGGLQGKEGGPQSVGYLLLKGHLDLYQQSLLLLPESIDKTTPAQRREILRELRLSNIKLPPFTMATLLNRAVREEEDLEKKIDMLKPPTDDADLSAMEFDAEKPTMAAALANGVDDASLAKSLQKGFVDGVVRLVCQGQAQAPALHSACSKLLTEWSPLQESVAGITLCALQEVLVIARFLNVLIGTEASPTDLTTVAAVADARSGSKVIVKQV